MNILSFNHCYYFTLSLVFILLLREFYFIKFKELDYHFEMIKLFLFI